MFRWHYLFTWELWRVDLLFSERCRYFLFISRKKLLFLCNIKMIFNFEVFHFQCRKIPFSIHLLRICNKLYKKHTWINIKWNIYIYMNTKFEWSLINLISFNVTLSLKASFLYKCNSNEPRTYIGPQAFKSENKKYYITFTSN